MYENYFNELSPVTSDSDIAELADTITEIQAALQRAGLPPDSEIRVGELPNWGPSGYTDELDAPNDDEFPDYPENATLSCGPDRCAAVLLDGDLYVYYPSEGEFLLWNY